ncbi:hypothetical protein BEP19_04600 [Ammoniphilus oxalaticus]|uniref:Hydrolase n=1 Tax=Ammoniphilus oxalaticus TaxID=66863 RepID=A0A419SLY9_9BACL|nr:hypothetical protein [Ammoniphilus oxalaticus]RKD25103.1 hypothetical protein BEP19_04600 [Ammoniphilus oxalaticus]
MEKNKYYVTVQTGEILRDHAQSYQFEIEADDQQRRVLEELFEYAHEREMDTVLPAMTPVVGEHDKPESRAYDAALKQIYVKLHELGTAETRQHIETMNIL